MKLHHLIFGLIICAGTFGAGTTQAYVTTKQTVQTFGQDTDLFMITYQFGGQSRDFYLPITALRDTNNTTNKVLGYTILDGTGTTTIGSTTSLVLSRAAIKDGRYFIPAGTTAEFTIVTVWHRPAHTSPTPYRMLVTALPFTMNIKGVMYENHLNPSELQSYVTPSHR